MEDFKISKLEGSEGWTLWKFQIKVVLRASNLWEIVSGITKKPEQDIAEINKWNSLDAKAQKTLVVSMGEEPMLHVMNCDSSADMWSALENVYEQKSETSIHLLQQQFFQYEKASEDSISVHISKLQKLAKQVEDLGEKITDNMLITKILMTLPNEYKHFFSSWEATDKGERTLKNLTSRLCMEESRLGIQPLKSEAFVAKRGNKKFSNSQQNQENKNSKGKCFICKQFGHWKRDCPNRNRNNSGEAFIGERLFVDTSEENTWFADSGASEHMSYKKEWFQNYVQFETPQSIRVGNGDIIPAVGKGDIYVKAYDGKVWNSKFLSNVLYVPNTKLNLFSTNACLDKGYTLEANGHECVFRRDGQVCLKGQRENSRLFKLFIQVNEHTHSSNVAVEVNSLQTWHERMCHQDKEHVKKILTLQNVKYAGSDFFCEGCVMGKQHRMPFPESTNRAKDVGDLVHTDLCGPMQVKSIGGARFMVVFRDDYSNYRYVYCIKAKSDVSQVISRYLDQVEADTGKKVKTLRSDNGSEYVNKEVSDILRKYKVVHQKSTPYTPEHNGRAERDMRTVVEAARSMIHSKGLNLNYWGEAVNTVVFTLNRTGKSPQKNKTPFELWFDKVPNISILRVFGSDAYVHIPQQKRQKLDPKSKKGVFVGYQENCKGYRIWIPKENRIEISRNVIIRETEQIIVAPEVENCTNHNIERENEPTLEDDSALVPIIDSNDEFEDAENGVVENIESSNVHDSTIVQNDTVIDVNGPNNEDIPGSRYNLRSRKQNVEVSEINCALVADYEEPQKYQEAIHSNLGTQWKNAMTEEYESVMSKRKKVISNKWVHKTKINQEGKIERYKARQVIRGFSEKQEIDYKENIYMYQTVGYSDGSNEVCKLNKNLYGLKQASRCWNRRKFQMQYIPTSAPIADIFTMPLSKQNINNLKKLLNITNVKG